MENLPAELLEKVFLHLVKIEDVKNCFLVCIQWQTIIQKMFRNKGDSKLFTKFCISRAWT